MMAAQLLRIGSTLPDGLPRRAAAKNEGLPRAAPSADSTPGPNARGASALLMTTFCATTRTHVLLLETFESSHRSIEDLPTAAMLAVTTAASTEATLRRGQRRLGAFGVCCECWDPRTPNSCPSLPSAHHADAGASRSARPRADHDGPRLELGEFLTAHFGDSMMLAGDMKHDMTSSQHRGAWVLYPPETTNPAIA